MLHCGIIGLPLSGKSTVYNVITRAGAEVKPYAGGKTDPNRAVVSVPDRRFDELVKIHSPRKETPAQVEFVDLAGLSRGAGKGAGLGNAFLSFVADADALIQVIRCFSNPAVEHPEGSVDPLRDWDIVDNELIFRDLAVIENRLSRLKAAIMAFSALIIHGYCDLMGDEAGGQDTFLMSRKEYRSFYKTHIICD